MSEMKRGKNESFEAFMRRVKRLTQKSGKLIEVKKRQRRQSAPSRNVRRKHSVARAQAQSKETYLRKIGRLPELEEQSFGPPRKR